MSDAAKLADEIERSNGLCLSEYDAFKGHDDVTLADDKVRLIVTALRALALNEGERVEGAANEVEEAAILIFNQLCPGVRMTDEDIPHYEAAAKAVLRLSSPPETEQELDPADIWDEYVSEVPKLKDRSPQGAMAFAVNAILERYRLAPAAPDTEGR